MKLSLPPNAGGPPLIVTIFVSAISIALLIWLFVFDPQLPNSQVLSATTITPPSPPPIQQTDLTSVSFLLLGYGGPGHQGGFLTDTIIVAHINLETNQITLITIPRDLWVPFPDGSSRKINAAFAYGGKLPTQSKDSVKQKQATSGSSSIKSIVTNITGIPINYFIAVDFVGLQRAIGQVLDGIDVQVEEALDDPWYPIEGNQLETCGKSAEQVAQLTAQKSGFDLQKQFPCRYENLHFNSGLVNMEGGDALKFVRSRHSSSDFGRSKRQTAVLIGIKNKLFQLKAFDDAVKFFNSLLYTIQTDLDVSAIKFISPALKSTKDFQTNTIHLDITNVLKESKSSAGAFILVPKAGNNNWQEIHNFIDTKTSSP